MNPLKMKYVYMLSRSQSRVIRDLCDKEDKNKPLWYHNFPINGTAVMKFQVAQRRGCKPVYLVTAVQWRSSGYPMLVRTALFQKEHC